MESARANDLDVYEYLKHLLIETLNNHHLENPSVIDRLLSLVKGAARTVQDEAK